MHRSRRTQLASLTALLALLVVGVAPASALDVTPPTGTIEIWAYNTRTLTIDIRATFADADSGIEHLDISCDGAAPVSRPNATHLLIPALDPLQGGCPGYGAHTMEITAWNGDGLSLTRSTGVDIPYAVALTISDKAMTGELFSITPTYPDGYTLPADAVCRWEFRWGDDNALNHNDFDYTFGSLLFEGPKSKGYCGAWTFTLPYVPVRQYQVLFNLQSDTNPIVGDSWGFPDDGRGFITAGVGTTERRITSSNLPLVFMLPDEYQMTVGEPITYRLYPLGGISIYSDDSWLAAWHAGEHVFVKAGGTTFTFTPDLAGDWSVFWNGGPHHPYIVGAGYDPPARYADHSRPNTSAPIQRIGPAGPSAYIPATMSWTGSDSGWGIDHYTLQRSIDGGAWGATLSLKSKTKVVLLTAGHTYRFRIRAVDRAGNVGYWDAGPSFLVSAYGEGNGAIHYTGTWVGVTSPDLWKGAARAATTSGATAAFSATARSAAWVSERGPTMGSAKVYVNGSYAGTVNLYSATTTNRAVVWRATWATRATRTVKIVVLGTAGHPTVNVDGFVALR